MLYVGVYLWYAASMLKVEGQVVARISKGIRDCLTDMRMPDGNPLDQEFKEFLLQQAHNFAVAIDKDVQVGSDLPEDAYRRDPLPSAALLLDMLLRGNSADPADVSAWREELKSPAGVWLWHSIEESTLASMNVLRKTLQVCYVK